MSKLSLPRLLLVACLLMILATLALASSSRNSSPQSSPRGRRAKEKPGNDKLRASDGNGNAVSSQAGQAPTDWSTGTLFDRLPYEAFWKLHEYIPTATLAFLLASTASSKDPRVIDFRDLILIMPRDELLKRVLQELTNVRADIYIQVDMLDDLLLGHGYDGESKVFVLDDETPRPALLRIREMYMWWFDKPYERRKLFLKFGFTFQAAMKMWLITLSNTIYVKTEDLGPYNLPDLVSTLGMRVKPQPGNVKFVSFAHPWIFRGYPNLVQSYLEISAPDLPGGIEGEWATTVMNKVSKTAFDMPMTLNAWSIPPPADLEVSVGVVVSKMLSTFQIALCLFMSEAQLSSVAGGMTLYDALHLGKAWSDNDFNQLRQSFQTLEGHISIGGAKGKAWLRREARGDVQVNSVRNLV